MKKIAAIAALLALAAVGQGGGAASASAAARRASIVADVGLSEWGPPGKLSLDLRTGRYRLKTAPPRLRPLAGYLPRVRRGRLAPALLGQVRAAFAAAVSRGLVEPVCAAGGAPPKLIISNAETPHMVLTGAHGTLTASPERGCWTDAAYTLHHMLELRFQSEARPRG